MTTPMAARPRRVTIATIAIALGLPIVFATATSLTLAAAPHLRNGTLPDEAYVVNYVLHPTPAVLHIVPGLVFVVGAVFQVSARFRRRHLALHRRMGRVLLVAGLVSAGSALYIGIDHPFSGVSEASATIVFGGWMVWCLIAAFRAIRRRDVAQHRRWMIRAFVVALGITTVRVWTAVFIMVTTARSGQPPESDFPQQATFGWSFWLGFGMHAALAEWWVRRGRHHRTGTGSPAHPDRSRRPSGRARLPHG